jgi:lipopolysaccharide/colanic/teichoic acid biosynthesis glycosyltransferase
MLVLPLLILSILNRILSGSPVFYLHKRVGRKGQLFSVCKFRTMANRTVSDSTVTVRGDPRITPLGALLRRWKLDELPQVWNVLRGEMSFVGARPDVEGYMDNLEGESRVLLSLRPGISGPATLKYRDEEEILALQDDPIQYNDEVLFPDKVRINLEYYRRCSLGLDLRIMLITAGLLKSKPTDFWMN